MNDKLTVSRYLKSVLFCQKTTVSDIKSKTETDKIVTHRDQDSDSLIFT